ncbi:MAG: DNA polymerase III subunit delta [Chloroherpetonaceae bacterium]|nr:DNA polymerase III subunit delta [Chloroherpetonaceae bacterium]
MPPTMEIQYRSGNPEVLWKPRLMPVYLLFGEEERLKEEAVMALIHRAVAEDFTGFDLETLDAATTDANAILSAASQIPFGSERRVVLVRGMEQWRDRARAGEVETLAQGIPRLGSTACLILIVGAEEEEAKRKTAVSVKLDNAVKKHGALIACHAMNNTDVADWIRRYVQREGKQIEPAAVNTLVEAVGNETLLLEQELRKLISYAGEHPIIRHNDIAQIVVSAPEDVMFATVDAIVRKQTDRALTLLAESHRYDPKPQSVAARLLALLARQYRLLWQARFLAEKQISPRNIRALPEELAAELPGEGNIAQVAFKAGELLQQARLYRWEELAQAFDRILQCDLANKGGATDETGIFGSDPVKNLQLLVIALTTASSCPPAPAQEPTGAEQPYTRAGR